MPEKFYFVEALADGVWRNHRQMIVSLVDSRWCIDTVGVPVLPGVVYSFSSDEDADYFLTIHEKERGGEPRAVPLEVAKGQIVTFWSQDDAHYFVEAGKARWMSDDEVAAAFQAAESGSARAPNPNPAPDLEPEPEPESDDEAVLVEDSPQEKAPPKAKKRVRRS